MVATGLQADKGGRPPRPLPRHGQGQALGVGPAGTLVPALAHHLAVPNQDATDTGIGLGGVEAQHRQAEGAGHVDPVTDGIAEWVADVIVHGLGSRFARRSSCWRFASGPG